MVFSTNNLKVKTNKELGEKGEDLAKAYLEREGYRILERNFRTRFGELDIVATKKREYFFVEVKARSTPNYGHPLEVVPFYRLERLKKMTLFYAAKNKLLNQNLHISLLGIDLCEKNPKIIFLKDICE